MLTLSEYKSSMDKLNKININPYVRVRKGGKVDGKEQALVYLDQRDVFAILNEAFGVGYWQSEEWVANDGKSVGASIKFPVLLDNGTVYTYVYSSMADLIINTKKINNVTVETLAACNIPMTFDGYAIKALDMEEAVKGAASRALVRAATKFMRSIANLYNHKNLFYTANGQKPNLSQINFNAPQLGHDEEDEMVSVVETVTPVAYQYRNLPIITQIQEVAGVLKPKPEFAGIDRMNIIIDTIHAIAGDNEIVLDTSGPDAFKQGIDARFNEQELKLLLAELNNKLPKAAPKKNGKDLPKV